MRYRVLTPLPAGEREGPATKWWEGEGAPEGDWKLRNPLTLTLSPAGRGDLRDTSLVQLT